MEKKRVKLNQLTLVGLATRTNNKSEANPNTSKIAALVNSYWSNKIANGIQHRSNPNITYSVYTEYESDENGEYTYFIGETVNSSKDQDLSRFKTITIPESSYQKFTTNSGKMPDVVISAWQKIWQMNENDFGGKRQYRADFEIYDSRAIDPNNSVVDIYIGISN